MTPFTTQLVELREKATKGPWEVQDGCSWRRIGTRGHDGNVLCPSTYSAKDRHPDLIAGRGEDLYANLKLIVALVNNLDHIIAQAEALEVARQALEDAAKHEEEGGWMSLLGDHINQALARIAKLVGDQP